MTFFFLFTEPSVNSQGRGVIFLLPAPQETSDDVRGRLWLSQLEGGTVGFQWNAASGAAKILQGPAESYLAQNVGSAKIKKPDSNLSPACLTKGDR